MCPPIDDYSRFMEEKISPKFGQKRTEVIIDPSGGYDYSIVKLTDDKVLGMAAGNSFFQSGLPPDKSAYVTFHKAVGKLASSGIMPEYLSFSINFPSGVEEEKAAHFWNSLNIESKKFQAMIAARHISVNEEAREPFIGGTTAVGTAMSSFFLDPKMISDGDRVLISKTAGLESATLLAHLIPEYLESKMGQYNTKMAGKLFFKTSTIQEAQEALKFGLGKQGITGMKSAGDTGLMGAMEEFCNAGGFGAEIDLSQVPLYDEVREISELFDLNPYRTSSMGTMIITAPPDVSEDFIKNLVGNGIDVVDAGKVNTESNALRVSGGDVAAPGGRPFYDRLSEILKKNNS